MKCVIDVQQLEPKNNQSKKIPVNMLHYHSTFEHVDKNNILNSKNKQSLDTSCKPQTQAGRAVSKAGQGYEAARRDAHKSPPWKKKQDEQKLSVFDFNGHPVTVFHKSNVEQNSSFAV